MCEIPVTAGVFAGCADEVPAAKPSMAARGTDQRPIISCLLPPRRRIVTDEILSAMGEKDASALLNRMVQVSLAEVARFGERIPVQDYQLARRQADETALAQGLKRAIGVDCRQPRCIGDLLLGDREVINRHLVLIRGLEPRRELAQQVRDPLA